MTNSIKSVSNYDVLNIIKGGGEFSQNNRILYDISTDLKESFILINNKMKLIEKYINRNNDIYIKKIFKQFTEIALQLSLLRDNFHEFNERMIKNDTKDYTIYDFVNKIIHLKNLTFVLIDQLASSNVNNTIQSYKPKITEIVDREIIDVYNEILELYRDINSSN